MNLDDINAENRKIMRLALFGILVMMVLAGGGLLYGITVMLAAWLK